MKAPNEVRRYEALVNGLWKECHWDQLEKGDIIRCCHSSLLEGPPTEEFVVCEQPALKVDGVKGQYLTPLEDYTFTGVWPLEYVADVHGTSEQFIRRVNPTVLDWDQGILAGTVIKVPVPPWRGPRVDSYDD